MLTDLTIRSLPAPDRGVKRYWDKDGLCIQVSQGGAKTFYLVYGDDRRFLKLGRYPRDLSLADAREKVKIFHARRTLGIEEDTSPTTVQETVASFIADHCDVRNKPRTAYETKRLLTYLQPLAKRRIAAMTHCAALRVSCSATSGDTFPAEAIVHE